MTTTTVYFFLFPYFVDLRHVTRIHRASILDDFRTEYETLNIQEDEGEVTVVMGERERATCSTHQ